MKVKALRNKITKEFLEILSYNGEPTLFTSEIPILQPMSATIELMDMLYENKKLLENIELVELEVIEFGEVGADIRNKLTPPKTLVAILERYFDEDDKTDKEGLLEYIKKEMEQTKISVDYIADLL